MLNSLQHCAVMNTGERALLIHMFKLILAFLSFRDTKKREIEKGEEGGGENRYRKMGEVEKRAEKKIKKRRRLVK